MKPKFDYCGQSALTLLGVHLGVLHANPRAPGDAWDVANCFRLMEAFQMDEAQQEALVWKTAEVYPELWRPFAERFYSIRACWVDVSHWNHEMDSQLREAYK